MPETDPAEQEAEVVNDAPVLEAVNDTAVTEAVTEAVTDLPDDEASTLTSPEILESGKVPDKAFTLQDFVGTWVYKDKYRYVISLTEHGEVEYRESLSGGQALVGILRKRFSKSLGESQFKPPARKTALAADAQMTNAENEPQGRMRFWLTKEGGIRSNFKKVGSEAEWGKDIMAKRASPMKWNEDSMQDDEWLEVLDEVVVCKEPSLESAISAKGRWGKLLKGQKVQVTCLRSICPRGIQFAELTHDELECNFGWGEPCDASAHGFAAVVGSKAGAFHRLLKGPLERDEFPSPPTKSTWRIADMKADKYRFEYDKYDVNKAGILGLRAESGRPFLPSVPERTIAVAHSIVQEGWAYINQVGVDQNVLKKVHKEIERTQAEMTAGQQNNVDFAYRTDRRIFFDTNESALRKDIPGLNQLAFTLQLLVEQLGKVLERSPLRMRITGQCRPMLACYSRSAYYLPHVDNANGDGRVLTLVYYLNRDWQPQDGGRLRLYPNAERRQLTMGVPMDGCVEIVPREDSLAIFQADWMVHEVTAAEEERFALTLWFNGEHDEK